MGSSPAHTRIVTDVHDKIDAGSAGLHLEEELERWVAAAVITPAQADAIRRLEAEVAHPIPPRSRIPLVAEALGFLGGALTVTACVVATSRLWDRFSTATRLTLVGVVALLLIVAGRLVHRDDEPALAHLGSFLWVLATGTVAFWAAILAVDGLGWKGADAVFVVGTGASVAAVVLWAWRPAPLQHVATLLALAVALGGAAGQVDHVGGRFIGIALWALGATWIVLAWAGVVRPAPLAYAVGGALVIVAGRIMGSETPWLDVLSVLTALVLLAASVPTRSMALLWAGVAGVFVSVPIAISKHFGDSLGAPAVLFLAGVALIGVAVVASRLVREVRVTPQRSRSPSRVAIGGALLGVVILVVGLTVGFTRITDVPAFPSLRQAPDGVIAGSIAFIRPGGAERCVYLTAATGSTPERKLLCERNVDEGPMALSWNDAGHLVAREFSSRGPEAVEIDPVDGHVVSRTPAGDPGKVSIGTARRAVDGAFVEVEERTGGHPRLVLRTASGATRTIFVATGPRDYHFQYSSWSPDGHYALVVDSEDRLLVVDVDSPSPTARILATAATSPAWSGRPGG